jgi:hypothetical protein
LSSAIVGHSPRPVPKPEQTYHADAFFDLRAAVADQAPTIYAVWGGGATPAQALYMVGLILPPKAP